VSGITILHVSDLHLGAPFAADVAEALVRESPRVDPDVIVISGDFTQRAKIHEFADARALLDRLPPAPRVVIPGNHDVPLYRVVERLVEPYRNYRQHISEDLDQVVRVDGAIFVALNSSAPRRAITNGRINPSQLDFCERALAGEPEETLKVVVAHHHFLRAPDYERDQVMPGAIRALDRFIRLRVNLILGGHLHRAYIGNSLDIYPGADRRHAVIVVQCGTTTSRRGRGKERNMNSFNVIRADADHLDITHHMYFPELNAFAPVSQHRFPRQVRQYLGEIEHAREEGGEAAAEAVEEHLGAGD
jgi:3',5'-cyclic AMP phosphodiesterase CpdA